jgi:hypothetical protein
MTPRSKKPVVLETNNTSTRTLGQPPRQRHSTSPSCLRALGAGEYRISPEMPDRFSVTPKGLPMLHVMWQANAWPVYPLNGDNNSASLVTPQNALGSVISILRPDKVHSASGRNYRRRLFRQA